MFTFKLEEMPSQSCILPLRSDMTQHMATWSRANSKWQSMHLVSEYSVGLPPFHTGQLTILIHTGRSPSFLMTACVIHTKLYLYNAISTVSMAKNIFKTQDNICITSRFTPIADHTNDTKFILFMCVKGHWLLSPTC